MTPWAMLPISAAWTPVAVRVAMPSSTKPMWPTDEYAMSRFSSVWARQTSPPTMIAATASTPSTGATPRRAVRRHADGDPQQAVRAHLQQHPGQDHRADRGRLGMGVGQPGVQRPQWTLHREREREQDERGELGTDAAWRPRRRR